MTADDQRYTLREAADLIGKSVDTLRRWVKSGKLPGAGKDPVDPTGTWYIPASALIVAGLIAAEQLADGEPEAVIARRRAERDADHDERLLLCVEELASNALRHGRAPVQVALTAFDHFWLLPVGDAAVETPPTPAVDRDAADGGLGRYLVARVCGAHGWTVEGFRKVAWVRIDYTAPKRRRRWWPRCLALGCRPRAATSRHPLTERAPNDLGARMLIGKQTPTRPAVAAEVRLQVAGGGRRTARRSGDGDDDLAARVPVFHVP